MIDSRLNLQPLPPLSIAVIDDSPAIVKAVAELLTQCGHRVVTATSGAAAIALLEETSCDVIITDIVMPEKDGLELIRVVDRWPVRPKIIAITGGSVVMSAQSCARVAQILGADATLLKPFDFDTLMATLRSVVPAT